MIDPNDDPLGPPKPSSVVDPTPLSPTEAPVNPTTSPVDATPSHVAESTNAPKRLPCPRLLMSTQLMILKPSRSPVDATPNEAPNDCPPTTEPTESHVAAPTLLHSLPPNLQQNPLRVHPSCQLLRWLLLLNLPCCLQLNSRLPVPLMSRASSFRRLFQ